MRRPPRPERDQRQSALAEYGGQLEAYLAKQINAFRDGERVDVSMQPFVAKLTDQDVEDLAAYYANLTPALEGMMIRS